MHEFKPKQRCHFRCYHSFPCMLKDSNWKVFLKVILKKDPFHKVSSWKRSQRAEGRDARREGLQVAREPILCGDTFLDYAQRWLRLHGHQSRRVRFKSSLFCKLPLLEHSLIPRRLLHVQDLLSPVWVGLHTGIAKEETWLPRVCASSHDDVVPHFLLLLFEHATYRCGRHDPAWCNWLTSNRLQADCGHHTRLYADRRLHRNDCVMGLLPTLVLPFSCDQEASWGMLRRRQYLCQHIVSDA